MRRFISIIAALLGAAAFAPAANAQTTWFQDTFAGSAVGGWAAADTGQAITRLQGTASQFSQAPGVGSIQGVAGKAPILKVAGEDQADEGTLAEWRYSSNAVGASQTFGFNLRVLDAKNYTRLIITQAPTGKVTYRIQRQVNNVNTNLASGAFPVALQPGTWYWTRFEVVGEQFRARTWPAGGENEPTTWDLNATDPNPTLTHGSVGVREQSLAGNKNLARLDVSNWQAYTP